MVGRSMEVLYSDNGLIGLQELEWIQGALSVIIGLFHQIGLMENVSKFKMMMCHPDNNRSEI